MLLLLWVGWVVGGGVVGRGTLDRGLWVMVRGGYEG